MRKEGKKSAWRPEDPQSCREVPVNACWSIFIYWNFLRFQSSPRSVFLIPRPVTLFDGRARLSCMLALFGTYRVQAKSMKSAQGVEGVYWLVRAVLAGAPRLY